MSGERTPTQRRLGGVRFARAHAPGVLSGTFSLVKRSYAVTAALVGCWILSACTSSAQTTTPAPTPVIGEPDATPTSPPAASTETAEVAPTAVPPTVDDDTLIAAAVQAFESERTADLEAWDYLDTTVNGDNVELRICAWDGDSVYDQLALVKYSTSVNGDGTVSTSYLESAPLGAECLNMTLIETAISHVNDYNEYWSGVQADPTSYDPSVRAGDLMTPDNVMLSSELVAGWTADNAYWRGKERLKLPEGAVTDMLFRRYAIDDLEVLVLMSCHDMDPESGLYTGNLLLNDFRGENAQGEHTIHENYLVRQNGEWRTSGVDTLVWSDCFWTEDWLAGVNEWKPDPVPWQKAS